MQLLTAGQDTLSRYVADAPEGLGVAWIVQVIPSHPSTRVWFSEDPTAVQAVADVQAIPCSTSPRPGLATVCNVHVAPSQSSAIAQGRSLPTAMQASLAVQLTPSRATVLFEGVIAGVIDHEVPSHRSAKARD
jgi:hypothetical protein